MELYPRAAKKSFPASAALFLAAGLAYAAPAWAAQEASPPAPDLAKTRSMDETAASLSQALRSGKAIVLSPLLSDTRQKRRIEGVSPLALEVLWEKTGGKIAQFGMNRDADLIVRLDEDMALYAIDPGTWRLAASGYFIISHEDSRAYKMQDEVPDDGVGMVILEDRKDWVWADAGQRWVPPQTTQGIVETPYCHLVIAGSTQCVSWGTYRHFEERVTEAGRWERDSRREEINALAALPAISKKKPFATFNIAAGEVLLLDAFEPSNFAAQYDEDACVRLSRDKVSCRMSSISYDFRPASIDRARASMARLDDENLKQLLAKLQYRAYTITAEGGRDEGTGTTYYYLMTDKRKEELKRMFQQ